MNQSFGNIAAKTVGVATDATTSGNFQKDAAGSSTDPKFGDVLQRLQSEYGAKTAAPREIKKTLGKDDFLKIMITQMQHQDPTSPFKAEQMAQEMAQFASVEQMQNMNRSLEKMTTKDQPLERLAMTNLIGKTVTIDRSRFPHTEGNNEAVAFALPRNASDVKIALVGESGEVVLEKDLGPRKAGEGTFDWDGLKSNTLPAKSGTYMVRVDAKDESGMDLDTSAKTNARVIGVSFQGPEPVFLVGDAHQQAKVTMRNIIQIDDPSAAPSGGMQTMVADDKPNFIAFKKGVGSSGFDSEHATPEQLQAVEKYEQGSGGAAAQGASGPQAVAKNVPESIGDGQKGFPNGLQD